MTVGTSNIYQTGEHVAVSGTYEVVGAKQADTHNKKEKPLRLLQRGEIFPNYEGWEVCWHLANIESQHKSETPAPRAQM